MRPRAGGRLAGWTAMALLMFAVGMTAGAGAEEHPGRAVFVAKGCAICHEERAVLQAPHITILRRDRSFFEFAADLWDQAPIMWANLQEPGLRWPRLTPREMADLAGYLNGAPAQDPPPDRSRGQRVLVQGGCLTCHAFDGGRAAGTRDLAAQGRFGTKEAWTAAMWNHAPSMMAMAAEHRLPYPELQPQDMAALFAFLREADRLR